MNYPNPGRNLREFFMPVQSYAKWVFSALALAGVNANAPALAATATGVLPVSAIVANVCIVAATPIVFGTYTQAAIDTTTALITVTCTPGVGAYTVGLDAGANGASTADRKVAFAGNTLNYGLYRNIARTLNWGDTTGAGADVVPSSDAATAALGVSTFNVYGKLPGGQMVAGLGAALGIGTYVDTVQITVNY